jgi:isoquinoline 1-oxidoreductase subunit beta
MTNNQSNKTSRRSFLKTGAIVLGGTVVATYFGANALRRMAAQKVEGMDFPAVLSSFSPDFWFQVLANNTVLFKSPKIEMGQGVSTGFAMLILEELDILPEQLVIEHANTGSGIVDMLGTGGSNSTLSLYKPIREVAATMREMLKEAAAKQWGLKSQDIQTDKGILTAGNRTATYTQIAQATKDWHIPDTPTLRPESGFKYVGKEMKRIDMREKVTGTAQYTIDVVLPDMLYALTLESPYFEGTLKSLDTQDAEKLENVVKIINQDGLVAVVANNWYAAKKGLSMLKATWNVPKPWQQAEVEAMVTVGNGKEVSVQKIGDAKDVLAKGTIFKQEYRQPMAAHAQMEVYGAIAHVEGDKATIIIGTQMPMYIRDQVAKDLGLDKDNVDVKVPVLGGGFGRRTPKNYATKAAIISKIMGKPIKIIPTREQEFQYGLYRPNTHHVLQAVIDKQGNIEAITHNQATADMVIRGLAGDMALKTFGSDWIAAGHGASFIYHIPNMEASVWNVDVPYPVSIWRGVGMIPNTFAIESFMNELAHKTGKDPIAMRIELCKGDKEIDNRYVKVLETLRGKSNWQSPKAEGIGRGMAIANDRQSVAATAVEVAVIEDNIVVKKVTQILDCGKAINPNAIHAQMEGATIMGISSALYEEILIKDGQMVVSNFHEYRVARMNETPEIQTFILENAPDPYGVGEPPLAPVAPAIAAAIFDLTGKNIRTLPLQKYL